MPAGEAPLIERQMAAVREGLCARAGRGDPLPGRRRRSAVGAGARAAVHRRPQDRSGGRLRAGRADRQRHRGRGVRSPDRRREAGGDHHPGGGRQARGSGGADRGGGGPGDSPPLAVRGAGHLPDAVPGGGVGRRRGARLLPGGARLRPRADQRLHRPRRQRDLRAHHPAGRRAPDGRHRQGVQRRSDAGRAGQARRGLHRQRRGRCRARPSWSSSTPCCARRSPRPSASCDRRWPASRPAPSWRSTRCWSWAAAGVWRGCSRSSRQSWRSRRAIPACAT